MSARRTVAGALLLAVAGAAPGGAVEDVRDLLANRSAPVVTTLTLFAGTREGLWKTGDWGKTWERVHGRTSGVRLDGIGAVRAIWPRGPQVWVAGDGGLYFSEDFGETWTPLSVTGGIGALLLSRWPEADPTVFVATPSGLLRSRDGGRSFVPTALAGSFARRLAWPGPALVVASGRGVLVTADEGVRFEGPARGLPEGGVNAIALSSYFAVDPVMWAAAAAGGVYRSDDGGRSFRAGGLEGERVQDLVWLGPFLYAAGEDGFFRKDGSEAEWRRISASPGRPHRLLFPLAPAAGVEAFMATDRGVFYTNDAGEHWQPSGLPDEDVLEIAGFPAPEPVNKKR